MKLNPKINESKLEIFRLVCVFDDQLTKSIPDADLGIWISPSKEMRHPDSSGKTALFHSVNAIPVYVDWTYLAPDEIVPLIVPVSETEKYAFLLVEVVTYNFDGKIVKKFYGGSIQTPSGSGWTSQVRTMVDAARASKKIGSGTRADIKPVRA